MNRCTLIAIPLLVAALTACENKPDRSVRAYREVALVADHAVSPSAAAAIPAAMPSTPAANPAMPAGASAPMSGGMPALPPEMQTPSLPLAWTTPAGWEEQPGSGMRIAAWRVEGQECTLMSFPGDVGGDEANIRRWLGQVGHGADAATLSAFVAQPERLTTGSGLEVRFFDLGALLPPGAAQSVLAAIIPAGDQSIFLKLMGDAEVLRRQKAAFASLSRSIALKPEATAP
ncbi:MAG TPA: hypothetical protein PKC67_04555 [Kiritimatiellia bacterium]|nr:hypothetical protein [Kiritimatiellia bacterium]HMP33601.1 hypothetical protein [Kiritimatiellia bacterium]